MAFINQKHIHDVYNSLSNNDKCSLKSLYSSEEFQNFNGRLAFPVGINDDEKPEIFDFAQFPHLMIAGTTGSGKTSFIQSMITGLISTYTKEELNIVIYDSKSTEYEFLNGAPQLIVPVITDRQIAISTIHWLSSVTNRRIDRLKSNGCRCYYECDDGEKMPTIIAVFDDFFDVSICGHEKHEAELSNILSKGRATGVYVILSTSIPTRQVVTPIIKSGFPARMSFTVASITDSKLIIDMKGAESLQETGCFIIKAQNRLVKGKCLYTEFEENKIIVDTIREKHC